MANQKFYKTDNQVKRSGKKNLFTRCLATSGYMYFFTAMFSIFGIIFIGDSIKPWLKVVVGIAFIIPNAIIFFSKARMVATRDYNEKNDTVLSNIHTQTFYSVNYFKSVLYVLPYVISALSITAIFIATKVKFVVGIIEILFAPSTLFFIGIGAHANEPKLISWMTLAIVATYVFIAMIAFVIGYITSVRSNREKTQSLVHEIRTYEQ